MTNDTANSDTKAGARAYEVGYGKPSPETQWQKGECPNPKGRPKKPRDIPGMIDLELHRVRPVTIGGRRQRITPKQLMVKALVTKAAQGDRRALTEIIALAATHGDGIPTTAETAFSEVLRRKNWDTYTDKFFDKQGKAIAAWKKEIRDAQPVALLLKRELDRKVDGTRQGQPAKIRMREVIVARFMKEAMDGDVSVLRLLLELAPEKKLPKFPGREIVKRPTESEQETLASMQAEEEARIADAMSEIKERRWWMKKSD